MADYRSFLVETLQLWPDAFASEMTRMEELGGGSVTPETAAVFRRLGDAHWSAVQTCDARYGHEALPSPYAWID